MWCFFVDTVQLFLLHKVHLDDSAATFTSPTYACSPSTPISPDFILPDAWQSDPENGEMSKVINSVENNFFHEQANRANELKEMQASLESDKHIQGNQKCFGVLERSVLYDSYGFSVI